MVKATQPSESNTAAVNAFMLALDHPLKKEIEAVRTAILKADKKIMERVKWNAPSFFCGEDIATIHVKEQKKVHLIFHHPSIVKIASPFLEGDYKDRRMMYFENMSAVKSRQKDLDHIVKQLVKLMAPAD